LRAAANVKERGKVKAKSFNTMGGFGSTIAWSKNAKAGIMRFVLLLIFRGEAGLVWEQAVRLMSCYEPVVYSQQCAVHHTSFRNFEGRDQEQRRTVLFEIPAMAATRTDGCGMGGYNT
jgi:homoaconitase/3-isopropylmalate dehydratase large subunit